MEIHGITSLSRTTKELEKPLKYSWATKIYKASLILTNSLTLKFSGSITTSLKNWKV